jgi:hypothetical protein
MPDAAPSTALDNRRDELLRSQAAQVTTIQQLPTIKIMAAGAGLFEFSDNQDTVREFRGVILNSHPRNVLWDKEYGETGTAVNEEDKQPACVANDGVNGQPRSGFAHLGLPANLGKHPDDANLVEATGAELISCASCPYNQFGSKRLISERGSPKGKANTNYKSVYVLVGDRGVPFEMRLPPTSIRAFDKYLTDLIGAGVPVQAIETVFSQVRKENNGLRWAQAEFARGSTLDDEAFDNVLNVRSRFMSAITPRAPTLPDVVIAEAETDAPAGDDDVGF